MALGKQITPLQRADIPELSEFLINGFRVPATSTFFSHEVLSWKYFDGTSEPSGNSVCSLIARSAGKIVGHIGICRRQLIVVGEEAAPVSTMHAIDWLGSADHPGSGTFLMLEAFATSKTQFGVGGSAQAQALLPRLGFELKPKVVGFRKVIAPFHRLRTTGQGLVRKWGGTAKDAVSAWRGRKLSGSQTVELRSAPAFTDEIDSLRRQSSQRTIMCHRNHVLLNYWLRYPMSGFSGWTIHTAKKMIGFAVLKITSEGQIKIGKIVDCWLDTEDPSCWNAAVAGLIDRLRTLSADDVTCFATTPILRAALIWNGCTKSEERNVFIRDKQQLLPKDLPFGLSGYEADGAIV